VNSPKESHKFFEEGDYENCQLLSNKPVVPLQEDHESKEDRILYKPLKEILKSNSNQCPQVKQPLVKKASSALEDEKHLEKAGENGITIYNLLVKPVTSLSQTKNLILEYNKVHNTF